MTISELTKYLPRVFGVTLCLVSLLYFGNVLIAQFGTVSALRLSVSAYASISVACLLYVVAITLCVFAWRISLHSAGEKAGVLKSVVIYTISQMAKYLPGNVAQHLGRVALAKEQGLRVRSVIVSLVFETAGVILAGALIVLITLLLDGRSIFQSIPQIPSGWVLTAVVFACVAIPSIVMLALRMFPKAIPDVVETVHSSNLSLLGFCLLLYLVVFLILGFTVDLIASGVFGSDTHYFMLATGIFAAAWIAGFLTPGAPAGVGVREAVLVVGLAPVYGEATAFGVAVVLRVVSTIGDGLAFAGGLLLKRKYYSQKRGSMSTTGVDEIVTSQKASIASSKDCV